MNNLKKVNKILAFTLLVLSLLVLADYSKSASRYYKDKDSIVFDTNLMRLYYDTGDKRIEFSILTDKSSMNSVSYRYSFDRNLAAFTQEELDANIGEEYEIIVDEGCQITSITNENKSFNLPNDIENKYTIKFENAPKEKEKINVNYSCPIDATKNRVETNVKIYEKIDGDYTNFLYLNYPNSISVEEYKKLIGITDEPKITWEENKMIVPKGSDPAKIKEAVRKWMWDYIDWYRKGNKDVEDLKSIIIEGGPLSAHTDEFNNPLEKYFYDTFNDFSDLSIPMLGLDIDDSAEDEIVFTLDDKFVGYALTDYHYANPSKVFYFSNYPKDKTETEEIFNYYVDKYMSDDKEAAYEYFNKIGGIYKVISGEVKVVPVGYTGGRLTFYSGFLYDGKVNYNGEESDSGRRSILVSYLINNYPEYFTDSDTVIAHLANTRFMLNVSRLIRDEVQFSDYMVYHYNDKDYLISVYNEIEDGKAVTNATVEELPDTPDYTNATTIAYMTYKSNKSEAELIAEIKAYAAKLDAMYGTNYENSITSELLNLPSPDRYSNGIQTHAGYGYIVVTFVNTMDAYNSTTTVGSVPDGNNVNFPEPKPFENISSNPTTPEGPGEDLGTVETPDNSTNTTEPTTQTPETQNSNGETTNKDKEETDTPVTEPNINGDGGDDE